MRFADLAMYRAKALGRGRHEVFDHRVTGSADRKRQVRDAVSAE